MAVRLFLDKSCGEDASDEDFPVRRMKRFASKKGVELSKKLIWRRIRQEKEKDIPKIYFLWGGTEIEGQPQRL